VQVHDIQAQRGVTTKAEDQGPEESIGEEQAREDYIFQC